MNRDVSLGIAGALLLGIGSAGAETRWKSEQVSKALGLEGPIMQKLKPKEQRLDYEMLVLPDGMDGWLFKTWRKPTLLLDNTGTTSRLTLGVYWNGLDDSGWPHWRILSALMKHLCGFGGGLKNDQPAKDLTEKYGRHLAPEQYVGGNAGIWRDVEWKGSAGNCSVRVRTTGSRWNMVRVTLTPKN